MEAGMDRDELIRSKLARYQNDLTKWARDKGALVPGEQIVLTARVELVPLVRLEVETHVGILGMDPREFFSRERIRREIPKCTTPMATKIRSIISLVCSANYARNYERISTLENFCAEYSTVPELLRFPNVGLQTVAVIILMLRQAGIEMDVHPRIEDLIKKFAQA